MKIQNFYLSRIILLINVGVFGYMLFKYGTTTSPEALIDTGAMYGVYFNANPNQWFRLITPMFIHIGFGHLVSNMIILYFVGPEFEQMIGSFKFITIYLLSGIVGNIACLLINPETIAAGASTAIFGIFGALLYYGLISHDKDLRTFGQFHMALIIMNIIYTFINPSVSVPGHIGGLVAGFLVALGLNKICKPKDRWRY